MKKIILALALVLTMGFGAKAQFGLSDAFFNDWGTSDMILRVGFALPNLPGEHGLTTDTPAPLGSGLFILGALGAGYAVARRKRDNR